MRTVLTIAGSDSSGGAGIQMDLATFAAHGVYGTCAVTAITAQSTQRLVRVLPAAPDVVVDQIDAVVADLGAQATKIGMLATRGIVKVVAAAIERHCLVNIVLDPVLAASAGGALLDAEGVASLRDRLLRLATVVTPNTSEAAILTGQGVQTVAEAEAAARQLVAMGARAAIVTGGHLDGPPVDVLCDGRSVIRLEGERIPNRQPRGAGGAFSAALAARLARGDALDAAARGAKAYVTQAIRLAQRTSGGRDLLVHTPVAEG